VTPLQKHQRLRRQSEVCLSGMVLIVEADTDDSPDIRNWWSDADMVIYKRQLIDIDCGDLFELLVGERLSCDIGEMLREITQPTLGINNGGFFATWNTETC
jgi:hypothetical protein